MNENLARALLKFSFILWMFSSIPNVYGGGITYLKEVGSSETKKLDFKEKFLYVFIAPNCSACKAQIKELSCLNSKIFFISLYGHEEELIREKRRLSLENPLYMATADFLEKLKITSLVGPQLVLIKEGKAPKKFIGLTTCKDLL